MRRARRNNSRNDGGFTLVELLVVLGVIAVLLSLLLPAVGKARSYAVRVQCAANMQQLYKACVLFANENKGVLPRPSWNAEPPMTLTDDEPCWAMLSPGVASLERGVVWRYISEPARQPLVLCPGDNGELAWIGGSFVPPPRNVSYSFNSNIRVVHPGGRHTSIKIQSVIHPAEKVMIYEELAPNDGYCLNPDFGFGDYPSGRHGARGALNTRREFYDPVYLKQGRGNYVFFDGHIETLRPGDIIGHTRLYRPLAAATY